jgi:hypothetical protein
MFPRAITLSIVALALASAAASALRPSEDLFTDFAVGWRSAWMERAMASRTNTFRLENESDNRFLRVDSENSASALWRIVDVDLTSGSLVSWRWRVAMSLGHIQDERRRGSDDYAARVAVMFDGKPFDRSTPLLMYVWAANETVGNTYPSPYTDKAATIVVRSGDDRSGEWISEQRDVGADFERFFGHSAHRVTGVALMVDTDNTNSKATAWFDELIVHGSTIR